MVHIRLNKHLQNPYGIPRLNKHLQNPHGIPRLNKHRKILLTKHRLTCKTKVNSSNLISKSDNLPNTTINNQSNISLTVKIPSEFINIQNLLLYNLRNFIIPR